jgi:pimeloyl-ACP methyl ester carboxylesterase
VLWIDPSGGAAIGGLVERLGAGAGVEPLALRVWAAWGGYGMRTEVDAVTAAAAGDRVHLAGVSAGGTIALAAALELGEAVCSVTLFEPAFVGDDDWDPVEARWRAGWRRVTALPPDERLGAFRRLLMRPGLEPPPPRNPPRWNAQDELLEEMLVAGTGFASDDLAAIGAPVLMIRGGRSNPRWEAVGRRLGAVCPDFREHVFPDLHHFAPPFRERPDEVAALLLRHWSRGRG